MPQPDKSRAHPSASDDASVAVVGAGSIGTAFTFVFAAAGRNVQVYEPDTEQRAKLLLRLRQITADLNEFGLAETDAATLLDHVSVEPDLESALAGVAYVQECGPEDLAQKRSLFSTLDRLAGPDVVLASSSSMITASEFAGGLPGSARCLVAHPGNPPYLIRVVEVVPAPFTTAEVLSRATEFLGAADLTPVVMAYCLVRDGVVGVEDIDRLVRDGLGLRWSVVGPFETVDLNTRGGIARHAEVLGPAYAKMGAERGQDDPWTPDLVARVEAERRSLLPLDQWSERARWRDRAIMGLLRARRQKH
jgi:3-hydroxyacyl-CoA dehydrogenase